MINYLALYIVNRTTGPQAFRLRVFLYVQSKGTMTMATISNVNPNGNLDDLIAIARDAVKHFGSDKLAMDKDKLGLRAAYFIVYQDDDYKRACVDGFNTAQSKDQSKEAKERALTWLLTEFGLTKPKKGAMGDHVTRFNNSLAEARRALADIANVYKRGIRMVREGKRVFVTAETYSKVMEIETKERVEVTMMKSKESVTFNGLKSERNAQGGKTGKVSLTPNAGNVVAFCQATKQSIEAIEDTSKLTGKDRLALLDVMFAAQIALTGEAVKDKNMLKMHDDLVKAQAS